MRSSFFTNELELLLQQNASDHGKRGDGAALMATILISACNEMTNLVIWAAEDGYRVIEAYDSGETMQQVLRKHPDVVVLADYAEPVEGEDLLPIIRRLTSS